MRLLQVLVMLLLLGRVASAELLSFPEAAQLMLEKNPLLAQRKIESRIAQKQWYQTRAAYFPEVDFVQSWSTSNNPVYVFGTLLNQRRFSEANFAIDSLNRPDAVSDFSSKFQLGWLLFDFGRRESRIGAAKSGYNISTLQEETVRAQLLQELVRRYFALSLSQQRLLTAEEALKSAQARLDQATQRVEHGMAVQTDLLSARVFIARRTQERIDAVNQSRLAAAALQELLGRSGEGETTTSPLREKEFPEQDLSWWQQEMKANRPELKLVRQARHQAEAQIGIERSDFLPSLQGWSGYEWHGVSLDYTGRSWGAGLELRWNLFRGASDAEQLSAARLQKTQAVEKERETENGLWFQVQAAYYHFQSAKEKWKVAKAILEEAAENKRIYSERYAGGLVTIQDLLQAETAYNETRVLADQNLYEVYVAYAELLAAGGKSEEIIQWM